MTPGVLNGRPQWRRAWNALRGLLACPERVELAFEVSDALDPMRNERGLSRILLEPEGRRLVVERPQLLDHLEPAKLAGLPEGSFGRAYLAHIERFDLDPGKLARLNVERANILGETDPLLAWWCERTSLCHDLWHVLTGYGADERGESALLVFSLAQVGGLGNAALVLGANARMLQNEGPGWLREIRRAWRLGRRSVRLGAAPFERLLERPLADVRVALGVPAFGAAAPLSVKKS